MCVALSVKLSDEDEKRADNIAQLATVEGSLVVYLPKARFRRRTLELRICEPTQGCACSLLTDNAYQGDELWDIRLSVLPRLVLTLQTLRTLTAKGFEIDLQWEGEKPIEAKHVTVDELSEIVRDNRIRTGVTYMVA